MDGVTCRLRRNRVTLVPERPLRRLPVFLASILLASAIGNSARGQQAVVTLAPSAATTLMTGRLFVIFARANDREPRFLAGSYGGSVPFYGTDVSAWKPGATETV